MPGAVVSEAKDLGEIPMASPTMEAPNTRAVVENRLFSTNRSISLCITETVQDRDVVAMEG